MVKSPLLPNPDQFYKFVNSKTTIYTHPLKMSFNCHYLSEAIKILNLFAECFRRYFSNAYSNASNNSPYQIINSVSIPNLMISETHVFQALRSMK